MDKSAIKSFAIEARKILMKSAITQAGFYGVSKDGCAQPTQKGAGFEVYRTIAGTDNRIFGDDIKRREKLVKAVEEKGFDQVIEETAYTWFNRLIAIRFMEVNGYLPTRTRVLSSETGSNTPDLMSQYMDVDLDMTMDELEQVQTCVRENRYDDAFALLFVKQCNALNEILPNLFEKTTDYMELLLKLSFTSDGVVRMLIDTIPESNFDIEQEGQIEIIGWMYQFYNVEPKAEVFSKNGKITKEEIPAATQLFTPDWIVRYMVENSLGRLWIEGHHDDILKENWNYYLEETEQEIDALNQLTKLRDEYSKINPEDIKVIDPCMGSGHILVYCFDVLMQIYESQGYTQRDAASLIIEKNLYGLDIDRRAAQLAYFAVMMKARQYDRRIFRRGIDPHIFFIEESNNINRNQLKYFGLELNPVEQNKANLQINGLLDALTNARLYGSTIEIENYDWDLLCRFVKCIDDSGQLTFDTVGIDYTQQWLLTLIKIGKIMASKYDVVITNPPYMSVSATENKLGDYIKRKYPDSKTDLFAVFIEKCKDMLAPNRFQAMITMHSWMFLSSYEKLREKLQLINTINMAHLGARAFEEIGGEVVQTTAFIQRNANIKEYIGCYCRLVEPTCQDGKEEMFLSGKGRFYVKNSNFEKIPGAPIAYWASTDVVSAFIKGWTLDHFANCCTGMQTGNNEKYIRYWFEINNNSFEPYSDESSKKWIKYNCGGDSRKWYGNHWRVINWENNGHEVRNEKGSVIRNESNYFKEGISWKRIGSSDFYLRYLPKGFIFDQAGDSMFFKSEKELKYVLGFVNTKVALAVFKFIAPTLNLTAGNMNKLPIMFDEEKSDLISRLVNENISLAKKDWDSFETSWDFDSHPFVSIRMLESTNNTSLSWIYEQWEQECKKRFEYMKGNEKILNEIFIQIYGLENEISSEIEDTDITMYVANLSKDVRSLISYAVGCMLGRYSFDRDGISYAGGEWDDSLYNSFKADKDNCIPVTDEDYFEDDIVGLFCDWMKAVFGEKNLETNLDFIAKTLGNKGTTSREVIRNYFINDFMKDHMKIYQKRPIYWMFDSGKQNGFKCLTYMHRYDKDTVGRVRSDYLRKSQEAIEAALKNAEYTIQNSTSAIDKATATKKRDKYIKQLSEIRTYFQALSHVALQRIDIDLDDGVKVNYEKFQNIEIVDENGKKQKINLLTKI